MPSRTVAAGILVFMMIAVTGCVRKAVQAETRMPVPVLAAAVEVKEMPIQVRAIGTVEPYSTVSVKSLVNPHYS